VSSEEPVTSPDQHKRTVSPRLARLGAFFVIIVLVAMVFPRNYEGQVEVIFLLGTAGLLLLIVIVDWLLRKNGLRS
jgi:hypothetical protein